jgi:hypothetical protein
MRRSQRERGGYKALDDNLTPLRRWSARLADDGTRYTRKYVLKCEPVALCSSTCAIICKTSSRSNLAELLALKIRERLTDISDAKPSM